MKINRNLRAVVLSVAALIGAGGFQDDPRTQRPQPEVLKPIQSFKAQYYDGKKLIMTVMSEQMIPIDNDHLKLVKPAATIYHEPKDKGQAATRIDVASLSGTFDIPRRLMHLTESVTAHTSAGARMETSVLDLDGMNKTMSTEESFRYEEPGVALTGRGFEMNHERKSMWVKKNLWGKISQDPRQRASGEEAKPKSDGDETMEFRSADGLRRTPLDASEAKEKGAAERYELTGDVHVDRTRKTGAEEQTDHLAAEFVEFLVAKKAAGSDKPEEMKSEISALHARDKVQVTSTRGGAIAGDDLTWNQSEDVMHVTGLPAASGQWGKNTFSAKRIQFDRARGVMQCLEEASARMEPEKVGQSPMTIRSDTIVARVESGAGEEHYVLKDFVAEDHVVLTWSDPKAAPAEGEPSRAEGRHFVWNQTEGQGVLTDTPFARVIQSANVIESPRMVIYNEPSRVILKGPKRLKVVQAAPEGTKEYTITSAGDMVMDPGRGHIHMLRDVTMVGTDIRLEADAMDVVLSKGESKTIESLIAAGQVRLENRIQKVKLSGDHLTWDPRTSKMIMTGAPFATVASPDGNIHAGEIHYDEKTGQLEGHRTTMKSILNVQGDKDPEKEKLHDQERRPQ